MKIAIIGTREFNDYEFLKKSILEFLEGSKIKIKRDVDFIVSGGAKGTDTLAEQFADEFNLKKLIFRPEWQIYGPQAGFLRNTHIIDNCDVCFAFWDGKSKGTQDGIQKAQKRGIPLYIISQS